MNADEFAFDVGWNIFQDRRGGFALGEWLILQGIPRAARRSKKLLREIPVVASQNVQRRDAAFAQISEDPPILTQRGHNQGRLKRSLRYPTHGGSGWFAGGISRREHVHAVGEQSQSFLLRLRVHRRSGILPHGLPDR